MKAKVGMTYRWPILLCGVLAAALVPGTRAHAQEDDGAYKAAEKSRIEREAAADRNFNPDDPALDAPPVDGQNAGPVRMARFSNVSGSVTWRPDDTAEWSKATVNLPIRQGAQVWVTDGGHADVQFDDGSELRLGSNALATLKTLYSDKDGEFTQIALNDGLATLFSRHANAVYQVDTPAASVKSKGAAQIRFGIDGGSEVTVQRGEAIIESPQGTTTLHVREYMYLADSSSRFDVRPAPAPDAWDRWNEDRNRILEGKSDGHVPSNIGLVSGELDEYGTWRNDPANGWVWCPRGVASDWRPYYDGRWTWVEPFGWTWVSNEPWGWAPYHYGTWVHYSYGWGWCPGPVHQYWSPGVVSFSVYDGCVAWAPLCPWEVHYPSALSFGYWGRDWAFSFSIGCAGVYYPYGGYCVGRPFNNYYANGFDRFHDRSFSRGGGSPSFDRFARTSEFAAANSHFVPYNASHVNGGSFARGEAFGGRGSYQALSRSDTSYFTRGRYAAAPGAGRAPVAGPPSIAPTNIARTPTRTFVTGAQPAASALNRNLYHAPAVSGPGSIGTGRGTVGSLRNGVGSPAPASGGLTGRSGTPSPNYGGAISRSGTQSPNTGGFTGRSGSAVNPGVGGLTKRGSGAITPGRTIAGTERIGINDGRVPRSSGRNSAEAARAARESLGMGGRPPYASGGAAYGSSGAGAGGRSSGTGAYGRRPDSAGSSTSPRTYGGSGASADPGYRSSTGRTYGGSSSGSDSGYRSSPGRTYGGSGSSSDSGYRTSPGRNYGGSSGSGYYTSPGRGYGSGQDYGAGGYSSGRSRGYNGDTGQGRTYGGSTSGGRTDNYSGGRSNGTYSGSYGGRSGDTGSRSSGAYGGGNSGRSSDSGGRSGGYSGGGRSGGDRGSSGDGRSSGGDSGRSSGGDGARSGGGGGGRSGR